MRTTASVKLSGARVLCAAAILATMPFDLSARVGLPVWCSLGSADELRRGEPATVHVVIQSAIDAPLLNFEVIQSSDWQLLEGVTHWTGDMKAGEAREFQFRAIPLRNDPKPLAASLRGRGYPPRLSMLDPGRMGLKFPERMFEFTDKKARREAPADIPTAVEFEPGVSLPQPARATEPRVPGQPATEAAPPASPKSGQTRAASVTVTATGRFVFPDDTNVNRGVRNATVELWNQNPAPSFGDQLCASGLTDGNGNFSITATCGDFFDGPDLFVRIVLNNSVVEVKPDNIFAGSYTFQSGVLANRGSGNVNFGVISVNGREAFLIHNLIMRAHRFMQDQGEPMSKVTALFPAAGTFYTPVLANLSVEPGLVFDQEGVVFHEYGHHVLVTKAESPAPDYDNGNCDDPDPGHCQTQPELGVISWTEGWPHFLAAVLHSQFNGADGYGDTRYRFEDRPDPADFDFPGEEDRTEGVVAAVLWDLFDTVNDDQDEAGAGRRDDISFTFQAMWNVVTDFDPSSSDWFHNHPTSIHEFWSGLRLLQIDSINRVSEAYAEHNIVKPRPNLEMSALSNPPAALNRGATMTIANTVRNDGDERANNRFTIRFQLVPTLRGITTQIGTRQVAANLLAGVSNSPNTALTIPSAMALGTYRLRACADSGGAVPESDEGDNCRTSTTTISIR